MVIQMKKRKKSNRKCKTERTYDAYKVDCEGRITYCHVTEKRYEGSLFGTGVGFSRGDLVCFSEQDIIEEARKHI